MITWTYTDQSRRIAISDCGRHSCLASALPEGTPIADPSPPSMEVRAAAMEAAVQSHLDAVARADGWDSIYTAMARAGFPGPFHAHGLALAQWADACWAVALAVKNEVMAGTRQEPEPADLIALLPEPPALVKP